MREGWGALLLFPPSLASELAARAVVCLWRCWHLLCICVQADVDPWAQLRESKLPCPKEEQITQRRQLLALGVAEWPSSGFFLVMSRPKKIGNDTK